MGTKRDDFSKDTVRKARERVGTRCSFPGCHKATVGASMENSTKVSITGVAAHICAAASGGPRFDEKMSEEARKSIDNCIWLCQTHARLIDTDVDTYSADLLRQWKKDAEKAASMELASTDFVSEYFNSNGNDLSSLKQLLDDWLFEGDYKHIKTILVQYKTKLSDTYEEFILRYKVIYDVYCSRASLEKDLTEYLELPSKTGINDIIALFVSFLLIDELKKALTFCESQDLKRLAGEVISERFFDQVFATSENSPKIQIPEELSVTVSNLIINYMWNKKIQGSFTMLKDLNSSYAEEFYYHVIESLQELTNNIKFHGSYVESMHSYGEVLFLRDSLEAISFLDVTLQKSIWETMLMVLLEDVEVFNEFIVFLPDALKSNCEIKEILYNYQILYEFSTVDLNELFNFAVENDKYLILLPYLNKLAPAEKNSFLDDHKFVLRKNIGFLEMKCELFKEDDSVDVLPFLRQYEEDYQSGFSYHCLLANYLSEGPELIDEFKWLNEHKDKITIHEATAYLYVLRKHKQWDDLETLMKHSLPNELKYRAGVLLFESLEKKYYKTIQKVFQNLREQGWKRKGLSYYIGIIDESFGQRENAKKCFKYEYDTYHDVISLWKLIILRYESNEFIEDYYSEELKKHIDAKSQNLLGATYLNLSNNNEAKRFFLRSLLLDDSRSESLFGFWMANSKVPMESANTVKENTVCVLEGAHEKQAIAIHSESVIEGISPNQFANCSHYSICDTQISALLFHGVGEKVSFLGKEYIIKEINSTSGFFSKYFFSTLEGRRGVITIKTSNQKELVSSIENILVKASKETNEIVQEYNHGRIRLPISALSNLVGKSMLVTCEFLVYENQEHVRNNLQAIAFEASEAPFVFSYDSIVLLAHIGIEPSNLLGARVLCAQQVKNRLITDIKEERQALEDNCRNYMFYKDGHTSLVSPTPEMRRNRFEFLNRLKALVDSFEIAPEADDFVSDNPELRNGYEELFSSKVLLTESGTLALAKKIFGSVLITDDQFLYSIANSERIPNAGLAGLLTMLSATRRELVYYSKKLHSLNFINYIPFFLYKKMDLLVSEDGIDSEIQNWLMTDTGKEPTEHHENIIIALFKDYYQFGIKNTDLEIAIRKAAISIVERRNPGFIQKSILGILQGADKIIDDSERDC